MSDLQPKIDKWWAGLTPEEREEWWSEGDLAHTKQGLEEKQLFVVRISRSPGMGLMLWFDFARFEYSKAMSCTPAPCAQLWWKLEVWLGNRLMAITPYIDSPQWHYALRPVNVIDSRGTIVDIKRPLLVNKDRPHALLDAVLAVQRAEG